MHSLFRCYVRVLAIVTVVAACGLLPRAAAAEDLAKVGKSVPNPAGLRSAGCRQ